jgi:hypothetical protein
VIARPPLRLSVIRAGRHADIERQTVCTELSSEHFALQQTASHYHALSSISCLAHSGPATALAFYDFVALLQQPLALAILALLLLLDVGAFFVGHDEFQTLMRVRYAVIAPMTDAGDPHRGILVYQRSARYLSQSLPTLWLRVDAHTPKGDVGPINFDPVTNSQKPDINPLR